MVTVDYVYEAMAGPDINESLANKSDILETVIDELRVHLNPDRNNEIDAATTRSRQLFADMQLQQETLDIHNPYHKEKITLLVAISYATLNPKNDYNEEKLKRQLLLIFGDHIKNPEYDKYRVDNTLDGSGKVYTGLLEHFWGEEFRHSGETDFYAWIKREKVTDNVLVLPINDRENHDEYRRVYETVWEKYNVPKDKRHIVTAVALMYHGFVILQKGADKWTRDHELSHVENDGVGIGELGRALDEVMTEFHAGVKSEERDHWGWDMSTHDGLQKYLGMFSSHYADAKRMFTQLIRYDHNLLPLFISRYREITETSSIELRTRMINDFGLDMYSRLFLAHGDIANVGEDGWAAGLLWVGHLTNDLYYLNDELGKPNEW